MNSGGLKKLKDADKLKEVKIENLDPPDKDGLLVKQGGSRKTWNKRWFVLKDGVLYYFKNKSKFAPLKGTIRLQANSLVEDAKGVKKKFAFQVTVMGRVFVIRALEEKAKQEWIDAIAKAIKSGGAKEGAPIPSSPPSEKKTDAGSTSTTPATTTTDATPAASGDAAKGDAAKPADSTPRDGAPKDGEGEKKDKPAEGSSSASSSSTGGEPKGPTTTSSDSSATKTDTNSGGGHSPVGGSGVMATRGSKEVKPSDVPKTDEKDAGRKSSKAGDDTKKDAASSSSSTAGGKKEVKNTFPRLLHVSGNGKNINILSVPVSVDSLNLSDVFILDTDNRLYQFTPEGAGIFEKNRAAELCRTIDDDRGSDVQVSVITNADESADANCFWALLGGKKADIPKSIAGQVGEPPHMYKVQQPDAAGGKYVFESMDKGYKISKNLLDTKAVMVFDLGFEVYVWVGLASRSFSEETFAAIALDYKAQFNRPDNVHFHRILEGGEPEVFECFLSA